MKYKKKLSKIKLNRKHTILGLAAVLVVGFLSATVYEQFELRGLRARMHTLENRVNDMNVVYEETADSGTADYEELSKETKTIRVIDTSSMNFKFGEVTDPVYITKKVTVYKVKVTNDTEWQHDFSEGTVKGKTESGRLVEPIYIGDIHPDDATGNGTLSLAPGGVGEVYIYIPADQGELELYFGEINPAI